MTVQTSHHYRSSGAQIRSPVDDQLYDLLQVIVSKCEAIEAYAKYEQDADEQNRRLFQDMAQQDAAHIERLLESLRTQLRS